MSNKQRSNSKRKSSQGKGKRLSVYERHNIWDQNRKNKIEKMRETLSMNEVEDCTFKPQLVSHNQSRNQDYEEDEMAEQNYELEESDI